MDSVERLSNAAFTPRIEVRVQPTGFVLPRWHQADCHRDRQTDRGAGGQDAHKLRTFPPRFQPNSRFVAALRRPSMRWRQFETDLGCAEISELAGPPPTLLRPLGARGQTHMDSTINAAATEANYLLLAVGLVALIAG